MRLGRLLSRYEYATVMRGSRITCRSARVASVGASVWRRVAGKAHGHPAVMKMAVS